MFNDRNWKDYVPLAEHYIAIGQTAIYLSRNEDLPWEWAGALADGGLWRNNMPVSLKVEAPHDCGLTFEWSVDMERPNANGLQGFRWDASKFALIRSRLPDKLHLDFDEWLQRCAEAVDAQGQEALDHALMLLGQGAALKRLATS